MLLKAKLGLALDILKNIFTNIFEFIKLVITILLVSNYNNSYSISI